MISTLATTGYDSQDLNHDIRSTFTEGCKYVHTDDSDRFIPKSWYVVKINGEWFDLAVDYIDPIANELQTEKTDCKFTVSINGEWFAGGNMAELSIVISNVARTMRVFAK